MELAGPCPICDLIFRLRWAVLCPESNVVVVVAKGSCLLCVHMYLSWGRPGIDFPSLCWGAIYCAIIITCPWSSDRPRRTQKGWSPISWVNNWYYWTLWFVGMGDGVEAYIEWAHPLTRALWMKDFPKNCAIKIHFQFVLHCWILFLEFPLKWSVFLIEFSIEINQRWISILGDPSMYLKECFYFAFSHRRRI